MDSYTTTTTTNNNNNNNNELFHFNEIVNKKENNISLNIETNIMKDVMDMLEENCRQKKIQLNNANIQLNNTEQEKWFIRDQFCSQVWNFSRDHDFSKVFQYYPYIINSIKHHDCPYNNEVKSIKNECNDNADMQFNEDIQKLSKEISILTEEVLSVTAKINLQETTIKKRKNNNLIVNRKKDNALTFTTAKELLEQFKSCSPVLIQNDNAVPKTIVVNNNAVKHFIKDEKKEFKSKFTVKIQSNLSLKFEQNRQLKEKEKKC
ncbi:hypothetical protein M0802_005350 [Mischocyttarus mexicanus]|nr:hypothetical protein M0802_005350 [Mischocyttarus mexicanus]